ncbi:MAG: TonB-dependent receptor [Alistipes sp.]|nr:TonB-dependent receptor [Alistipes sp.]
MKKALFITLSLLFSTVATAFAQNITGKVLDSEGNPLPGASVYWADTNVGEASDIEGRFRVHRVKGYDRLVGSFLGYNNDTVRIDSNSTEVVLRLTQGVELESVVIDSNIGGNYIRQDGILKGETISFAGLCKMACCNLAESFENSASVTVGYSDAISGARQIKMLGLAGTYTQILDENRAIMRGLSAPYGLGYTPGMWLNSIQVSKGIASVTAGHEAITGQINLEHRKPTDDERLFLNLYFDNELKPEINLSTAIPVTKDKRLTTIILAHGAVDTKSYDHNHDGFRDLPQARQFSLANRWLYQDENGTQVRWGAKYVNDYRLGGQYNYTRSMKSLTGNDNETWRDIWRKNNIYGSEVRNEEANVYFKMGRPVGSAVFDKEEGEELRSNIAMVVDYDYFREDAYFGADKGYLGTQNMANANLMYSHYFSPRSSLIAGISASTRFVDENLADYTWLRTDADWSEADPTRALLNLNRNETEAGAYVEYTYNIKEKLSIVAGIRYDYNFYFRKHLVTPRGHIKWNITPTTVLRASAGLGYRPTDIVTDNIGILATGRRIVFDNGTGRNFDRMEQALTAGGSLTQTISTINYRDMTISFDYFRTQLFHSIIVDQERDAANTYIYETDGRSYTNTYQFDLTWTPVERFDIFATFRWTDSRYTITRADGSRELVERPLVGQFKTLINLQYATRMRRWVFDVTAQLNGRSRIPTQNGVLADAEYSPIYPMFYAQISRKIKNWDIYLGCENIAGYKQKRPIIATDSPYSTAFNSACVWGPLMGRKIYIGVRFNLY